MSFYASLKKITAIYQHAIVKYPGTVQAVQVSALLGIGDVTAQLLESEKIDLKRTAKFASIGLIYVGPVLYVWYSILNKFITGKNKSIVVIKKVILDQVVYSPLGMAGFLVIMGIIERHDMEQIKTDIHKEYFELMRANYILWPAVQFVNFYFVPHKYQIVFNQSIAVLWNTYVSYKTHD